MICPSRQHARSRWFAFCALALLAAGCASRLEKSEPTTLGYIIKNPETSWFQAEAEQAQAAAGELGVQLIQIPALDTSRALEAIDAVAEAGGKGAVICAPDVTSGDELMARAETHGLRLYTVDDRLYGRDGKPLSVPYLGVDAMQVGAELGRFLESEAAARGWKLADCGALVLTWPSVPSVQERTDAAREVLLDSGLRGDRVFEVPLASFGEASGEAAARRVLATHPEVERWLVFAGADAPVIGAMRAFERRKIGPEGVIGAGIGAHASAREFARPGSERYAGAILINPVEHGRESVRNLAGWVRGGIAPPQERLTTGTLMTRATYRELMRREGIDLP